MKVKINKLRNIADTIKFGTYTWTKEKDGFFYSERTEDELSVLIEQYGAEQFDFEKPKATTKKKAQAKNKKVNKDG